jgi:branched-chain amino acid transport system ATP-binding protein
MSGPMLDVKDLVVTYGDMLIIKNLSMYVNKGEIVGIIGPNGHGKTTLLKAISGLVKPKSGKIFFENVDLTKMPPHKIVELGIVQVPQGAKLWPKLTVEENLLLGAYVSNAWKKRKENLEMVYKLFPALKERRNKLCSTLSGGERQMVAIGRGLMSSAKLLTLDEPSLGLAPLIRRALLEKIPEIRDMGVTLVLVEQNVVFASEFSDRLYLIEEGKITLQGSKDEVLSNNYVRKAYLGVA